MDEALVKHAQHDIERGQGRQDEQHLIPDRIAVHLGRALEAAHDGGRHADAHARLVDGGLRLRKGRALRQVEGQGHGSELALMGHGKGREGR